MMYDGFFKERVILDVHRMFAQLLARYKHDQPDETQCQAEIKQAKLHMGRERSGKYHLVKIEPMSEYNKHRHER